MRLRITHARKIVVLGKGSNNGLDMNRFPIHSEAWSLGETELRSSLGLSKETPVVGFVGRLTIDKGIRELLEAFDRLKQMLPSVKLLIVGTFEEEDPVPQDLRSRIESDPSIVFVPYQQEPAPYYALMNVFLFPTYREGFGNVILEAGAAGIPVVATDVTGVKDAVVHEVTGFIVPVRDGQALADAAAVLLQDRKLAERLGRNGRERVEREYRSEIIWDALDQFYLEMLAARG